MLAIENALAAARLDLPPENRLRLQEANRIQHRLDAMDTADMVDDPDMLREFRYIQRQLGLL